MHLTLMIKYVVTWFVVSMTLTAPPPPKPDAYGLYGADRYMQLAIACFRIDSVAQSKYFDTMEDAQAFVTNAPAPATPYFATIGTEYCINFKIDSLQMYEGIYDSVTTVKDYDGEPEHVIRYK